jgi:DNA mismatch repair protein MutL
MPPDCARIRQLPEALANQIAAGEVIERPAAIVKELCENSLDAGATVVRVRTEDGGRRLVQVEDDGGGIAAEDLPLALARHATSKIASAEDLFRIGTLGFRGEALPSIAAVSEMTISSRPRAAEAGRRLVLRGAATEADETCALAHGTVVAVRNLFWNVPARLKFLKSEASETGHITEQVIRLALGHPAAGFHLVCDGRTVIEVPSAQAFPDRIRALFGAGFASSLLAVAHHIEGAQVAGFVAHPREAKPTAKRQYTFVNNRWVRDKLLLAAVREGFKGHLEPRLHGAVILHLDCDPALVDVNVHPTKSEVRFRREGEIFALVSRAVAEGLRGHSGEFSLLTPGDAARVARTALDAPPPAAASSAAILSRTRVREPAPGIQERYLPHLPAVEAAAPTAAAPSSGAVSSAPAPAPLGAPAAAARAPATLPTGVRRVLQLNSMFLLIETDSGIRLVDQHALHEKALFLALDESCGELAGLGSQQLLVPRVVELTAGEVAAVEPLLSALQEVGIEAEVFGPTTVLVRAFPPRLKRLNWAGFFATLAESGSRERTLGVIRERIRHSAACHGAVKAGQELSAQEQLELVAALYELEGMEHCPHGRPTTLDLPWAELARRFQRS